MAQFIGTHQGKLDAKSRVSIPATFRSALKAQSLIQNANPTAGAPLVLRPSHKYKCIEAWSEQAFEALSAPLAKLEDFSEAHDDLAITLFADACPLETDKEGRIVLPASLIAHAGLTEQGSIAFMGVGKNFQIWDVATAERRRAEARQRSAEQHYTLPGAPV